MDVIAGHPSPEAVGTVDSGGSDEVRNVVLDRAEILELLIEMARQQQHRVFEFALAAAQRALERVSGHDPGANGNRSDQQQAADDEPADRAAACQSVFLDRESFASHRRPLSAAATEAGSI